MSPPVAVFPASDLPAKIQLDAANKRRKPVPGTDRIDLSACELLEMMQFSCVVEEPAKMDSPTRCREVPRAFRRCMDRKGSFMVETTSWEGSATATNGGAKDAATDTAPQKPIVQWNPADEAAW